MANESPDLPDLQEIDQEAKASLRILVVDDERTLRESCRTFLESEGYAVESCAKGQEALALLSRRPFDIVLIDLYMSEIPGLELLDAALGKNANALVIVMTGNPSVASSIEALKAGAWDYLTKPFSASQLQV